MLFKMSKYTNSESTVILNWNLTNIKKMDENWDVEEKQNFELQKTNINKISAKLHNIVGQTLAQFLVTFCLWINTFFHIGFWHKE